MPSEPGQKPGSIGFDWRRDLGDALGVIVLLLAIGLIYQRFVLRPAPPADVDPRQ